jgi:hypothetical protein
MISESTKAWSVRIVRAIAGPEAAAVPRSWT